VSASFGGAGIRPSLHFVSRPAARIVIATAVVAIAWSGAAGRAWAVFAGAGAGRGSVGVATLVAPSAPGATATSGSSTVALEWVAAGAPSGSVKGYWVDRSDGETVSPACGTGPGTLVASTHCDDLHVAGGTYTYRVHAVFRSWTALSAPSSAVVVEGDHVAPDVTVTFPVAGNVANAAAFDAGCRPLGFCGAVTDPSGVATVTISVRAAGGDYWDGSRFGSSTEVMLPASVAEPGSTVSTWSYPFALPADGTYTLHLQAADAMGNATTGGTYSASATATIDCTSPVLQALQMLDSDQNGKVDTVVATFDDEVAPTTSTAGWLLADAPSGATLGRVSSAGRVVTLHLTEGRGAADTGPGSFTVALAAANSDVHDAAGNPAAFAPFVPSDGAEPVVVSVGDQHGAVKHTPGKAEPGDTLDVTFSEPMASVMNPTVTVTFTRATPADPVQMAVPGLVDGTIDLGAPTYFVSTTGNHRSASFAGSQLTATNGSRVVRITLGPTVAGNVLGTSSGGVVTFTPSGSMTDPAMNGAAGRFTSAGPTGVF
jgi:hypothetical protein